MFFDLAFDTVTKPLLNALNDIIPVVPFKQSTTIGGHHVNGSCWGIEIKELTRAAHSEVKVVDGGIWVMLDQFLFQMEVTCAVTLGNLTLVEDRIVIKSGVTSFNGTIVPTMVQTDRNQNDDSQFVTRMLAVSVK